MRLIPLVVYKRIEHRPNLVKIVDNIGWLFFDKILRMGVGLFVGVWIARYLGPEQFGLLNFALAFLGLSGAVATLGLRGIVVRDIVRDPDSATLTLGTAAFLQFIGGMFSFLLILGVIVYLRPDDPFTRSIVAIVGAMVLFKVGEVAEYWFESQVRSKYTVWVKNSVFLAFSGIKIVLILQQAPLTTFVWAMLIEAAIAAVILIIVMGLRGPGLIRLRVSVQRGKYLLRDSWPLILSAAAITVNMKIDQIMLGQMINDEAVGIYSAAVRVSEIWYFIPMAIVASVFPALLEAKKRSEKEYYERLQKLYDVMVLISLSIALPTTFLSPYLVSLVFGDSYIGSGPILTIHIWASIFVFLSVASGKWFLTENRQVLALLRNVSGALSNIVLNMFLIPVYGPIGAAIATLVSYAIAAVFFDLFQEETRRMFVMKISSMNVIASIARIKSV